MDVLEQLAERKISEAAAAGELDDLPGSGRPLALEDLSAVDAELRGGYLLLRSAGFLPEEMELRKELLRLGDLLRACADSSARTTLEGRRHALLLRYDVLMERRRRG